MVANGRATEGASALESVSGVVSGWAVSSSGGRGWRRVEVVRARLPVDEMSVPPLLSHTVVVNLGGPYYLEGRVDGGRLGRARMDPGTMKIVSAGGPSEWRWTEGAHPDVLHLSLSSSFVAEVAAEAGAEPGGLELVNGLGLRDPQIERVGRLLLPELGTEGLGGRTYAESLANVLAVHLLRRHSSLGEDARRKVEHEPADGLSKRQLKQATDYVGYNLSGDLSLAELAAQANLSPRHFLRLFKESTGLSPHQYVIRERVERAKGLLSGTDLPVGEIALACGFAHQSHLSWHFKRLVGVTPKRFRGETGL